MNTAIADDVQARAEQVIEVVREQADTLPAGDQLPTEIVEASLAPGSTGCCSGRAGGYVALPDAASVIERPVLCRLVGRLVHGRRPTPAGSLLAGIDEAHAG